ncbi:MAG: hypothetical protein ABIP54_00875 [Candidatus Andersenbacteria bacterium]
MNQVDIQHIAFKGNGIYENLKAKYEKEKGKFLAIDTESGDSFLAESNSEAVELAKNKYPDHVFYVVKIGYSATERLASMAHGV